MISESGTRTNTVEINEDNDDDLFLEPFMYQDEYSIRLTKQPAGNVTVTLSSVAVASDRETSANNLLNRNYEERHQILLGAGDGLATIGAFTGEGAQTMDITFTPENWNTAQYIRVMADDDDIAEGVGKYDRVPYLRF